MADTRACVWPIIEQAQAAVAHDLYLVGLMAALAVPDILGALGNENGRATESKYEAWLVANANYDPDQADEIYGLRCSFLHQGSAYPHKRDTRLAFMGPGTGGLHNLSTVVGDETIGWLHIPIFVDEIAAATDRWLTQYGATNTVKRNLEKFAHLRPGGIPPHVTGPVIA